MLIEVDANKALPDRLHVVIPKEDERDPLEAFVRVEYPWRPSWCSNCSIFGHIVHNCPVLAVLQEKKTRDDLEAYKKKQGEEEFTVVQRRGKEKMAQVGGQNQWGASNQGWKFSGKKHNSKYQYANRGAGVASRAFGSDQQKFKGENSGIKFGIKSKSYQGNKPGVIVIDDIQPVNMQLNNNKFGVLASSNLIDNLENVSSLISMPETDSRTKGGMASGSKTVNGGEDIIMAFSGTSGVKSLAEKRDNQGDGVRSGDKQVGFGRENNDLGVGKNGSEMGLARAVKHVTDLSGNKQPHNIDFDKHSKFFRLKNAQNFNEEGTSEEDVESDGDDTANFLTGDFSVPLNREDCLIPDVDHNSLEEHEEFANNQVYGGGDEEEGKAGLFTISE